MPDVTISEFMMGKIIADGEIRGREQGRRNAIDRIDAEVFRLRGHYATTGWEHLNLDYIAGMNAAAELLESAERT